MSLIPTQKHQITLTLDTRRPSESAGMFINHDGDSEVEEIKAKLEDFDYFADNGNWVAVRIAMDYFSALEQYFKNLVIDFLLVPSAVFP
jgi:hypothetical protein